MSEIDTSSKVTEKKTDENEQILGGTTGNRHFLKIKLLPLVLTVVVFVLDQGTKLLIVKTIPPYTIGASFFGDFLPD